MKFDCSHSENANKLNVVNIWDSRGDGQNLR
jgi:hypothetical protein